MDKTKDDDKETPSNSFLKINDGESIIIKPSNKSEFNVLMVFGGMMYANPQWMLEQMPNDILKSYLVFIYPYTTPYSIAYNRVQSYMSKNGYKMKSLSMVGFSAGALNIQSGYDKSLKFFGLIDPSTKSKYEDIVYGSNAHMVYNNNNWGVYPNIKALQPKIAKNIRKGGGFVEEVNKSHASIPKYFFEKHL